VTVTPPRLVVTHDDLDAPVVVDAGRAVLVDGDRGATVVQTVTEDAAPGTVHLDGRRLPAGSLAARVRRGLAVVSGAPVADDVSVHDHLAAELGRRGTREVLAGAPLLAGRGADPAGVLSGGERRVLAWLRACAVAPRAVLLDRAAQGLDEHTLEWASGIVAAWLADGVAVVVRPGRAEERSWAGPPPPDPPSPPRA
jgi:ABC-type branched-subunit amino acid transport system ATPase component